MDVCPSNLNGLVLGARGRQFVLAATAEAAATLYDKYQHVDPRDVGRDERWIKAAKTRAVQHGFAPPWCWDEDTIDDPNAIPEWTGACGTARGYAIHQRDGIPLCRACREIRRKKDGEAQVLDPEKLASAMADSGISIADLAVSLGCSKQAIYAWRSGDYVPRSQTIDRVARALGVRPADLLGDRPVPG
ncbi:helix-turn-helix domain-containing protein [Streptomyces wuyuanensis]|uniref:helix-turn-helix domain-containing protein n=1 Tax=Streptomyces wuyuanensis TaxID=1196353 RepID=UPI0034136B22